MNERYRRQQLEPPVPTAELLRDCPSNIYRTTRDIAPQFYSVMFNAMFTQEFFAEYSNLTSPASRPGCWAYPDMLQVGNLPSLQESRTHFALWCITSAPLILSFDSSNDKIYDTKDLSDFSHFLISSRIGPFFLPTFLGDFNLQKLPFGRLQGLRE